MDVETHAPDCRAAAYIEARWKDDEPIWWEDDPMKSHPRWCKVVEAHSREDCKA